MRYLWERSCLSLSCCSGGVLPIRHGGSEGRQAKEAELDNSFFAPVTGSELLNKQVWMQQARRRQGKNTESICAWSGPSLWPKAARGEPGAVTAGQAGAGMHPTHLLPNARRALILGVRLALVQSQEAKPRNRFHSQHDTNGVSQRWVVVWELVYKEHRYKW